MSVNIPDPNLFIEIQNYIEELGGYVDVQLNAKLLKIRVEYFVDLALLQETNENRKKIIHNLNKQLKDDERLNYSENSESIGRQLLSLSCDITAIASTVSSFLAPGNPFLEVLSGLKSGILK